MAPTVPHILMTVHGALPGGEKWTCGLRTYKRDSFLSVASGNALAIAVANRWMTLRNSSVTTFGGPVLQRATVDGVTVREIDGNGIGVTQYEGVPSTAYVGTVPVQLMPNQCAIAVTLLTARAGRTGKGRFYLPCLSVDAGGLVGGALSTGGGGPLQILHTAVKIFLDGVNTDLATNFGSVLRLAVQSPTAAKAWFDDNSLADYNGAEITGYKIGNVIDTQRRRRSSVAETYLSGVLA